MRKIKIYNQKLLLKKLNIQKAPSIGRMIRASGITIVTIPNRKIKSHRAIIAIDTKSDESTIYLKKNLPTVTKRFIVTYLFAYIQLYYNGGEFYQALWEEENFDRKAYNYALRLMIPEVLLEGDIKRGMNVDSLAKKYKASLHVVGERINLMKRDKQKAKFKVIQGGRG